MVRVVRREMVESVARCMMLDETRVGDDNLKKSQCGEKFEMIGWLYISSMTLAYILLFCEPAYTPTSQTRSFCIGKAAASFPSSLTTSSNL